MNDTEQSADPEEAVGNGAQDQRRLANGPQHSDNRHGVGNSNDKSVEARVNDEVVDDGDLENGDLDDGKPPREFGGRKGPDPVRYGDWEKNGRCIDF